MNNYLQFNISYNGFEKDVQSEMDIIIDCNQKIFENFLALPNFHSGNELNIQVFYLKNDHNFKRREKKAENSTILCVSDFNNFENVFDHIRNGYSGCVSYANIFTEFVPAIVSVLQNKIYISPSFFPVLHNSFPVNGANAGMHKQLFTRREHKLIQLLVTGALYKEIAFQLKISENTVRSHIRNIYSKLKVHSKTELTIKILSGKVISSVIYFFTDYIATPFYENVACLCY